MTLSARFHLADALMAAAGSFSHRPALVVGGRTLTYRMLLAKGQAWASFLQSRRPGLERVGILAARSEEAFVGVVATILADATYVPLNAKFPQARTRAMIELADLDAIIVDEEGAAQTAALLGGAKALVLAMTEDGDLVEVGGERGGGTQASGAASSQRLLSPKRREAQRPAYLLFTSGSTGQPKGVPISHHSVGAFLSFNSQRYRIGPDDRLGQTFDLTFDLSVFDMFMAWTHGAALHVPSRLQLISPYRFISEHKITVWFCVPSLAHLLMQQRGLKARSLPSLRWSLFCGEPLPVATATSWAAAACYSAVENLYGPTELTIACAVQPFAPPPGRAADDGALVPIGKLYPHMEGVVLDEGGREVAGRGVGELCIAGPQQFAGYWRDEKKTLQAHVRLRCAGGGEKVFYRTGDRVWRDGADGPYHFVGRVDQQVKISGYRVELGEVEAVLRQVVQVNEAAAIGWPRGPEGCGGIHAFASGNNLDEEAIMAHARSRLPSYMVPKKIHLLQRFPLNNNGKIDKPALAHRLAR